MRWIFLAPFVVLSSFCLSTIIGHAQLGVTYGDAVNLGGGCYRLTNSSQGQNGAVWYFGTVDVTQSWEMTANLYLGSSDSGADGLVFVLRNIDSSTLGESGEFLGYGAYEYTSQSIQPSIGVEVDTQPNPSQSDPEFDHLAILSNGQVNHSDTGTFSAPVAVMPDSSNIEIGAEFELRVTYCASSQLMTVFWDDQQRISEVVDLTSIGANNVKWGFTAATGGAFNEHRVCAAQFVELGYGSGCECLDSNMNEICDDLEGCVDATACNFDSTAEADNGTCDYSCCPGPGCCDTGTTWDYEIEKCVPINSCPEDLNNDGIVGIEDLLTLLSSFGTPCDPPVAEWTCGDPVSYHGYDYETVLIGEQCWFAENLRTELYQNGDFIQQGLSDDDWESTTEGALCIYGEGSTTCSSLCDEDLTLPQFGRLYNGYAAIDNRNICPTNWHVAHDEDWILLEVEIGMAEEAANSNSWRGDEEGLLLKSSGWNGSDDFGFSALPGGGRYDGVFLGSGGVGYFWTPTASPTCCMQSREFNAGSTIWRGIRVLENGYSIRCIKD